MHYDASPKRRSKERDSIHKKNKNSNIMYYNVVVVVVVALVGSEVSLSRFNISILYLCIIVVYSQVFVRHTSIDFKVKLVSGSLRTDATIMLLYTVDRRLTAAESIINMYVCIRIIYIYIYRDRRAAFCMYIIYKKNKKRINKCI